MDVKLAPDWKHLLEREFDQPYFQSLVHFVRDEYKKYICYPPGREIFSAFDHYPFDRVQVVILGQDPYHGYNQANGLCFSVRDGVPFPPSLQNIFKELNNSLGKPFPKSGDLSRWAKQGVLLLNATLTVRSGQAGSHQNKGWEAFTAAVIRTLSNKKENIVFLLWGSYAQKKGIIIDRSRHHVLQSAHPSPLSVHRGFFGCRHFVKTNQFLKNKGIDPIDW
ncbi:MAG: uracil-DNA glycosylase [Flavobacteriales bacterium AspAUS03]